jgi:homoserine O-acetyltransferase
VGCRLYQWAVQYPDFMETIMPIYASVKTVIHNNIFLEGVKIALLAARGG